jgi:hypothetical protein
MNKMSHALLHDDDSCFKQIGPYTTATDNYIVPAVEMDIKEPASDDFFFIHTLPHLSSSSL